jgi:hypothetical protein
MRQRQALSKMKEQHEKRFFDPLVDMEVSRKRI